MGAFDEDPIAGTGMRAHPGGGGGVVRHYFSVGGVSEGPYASLNLGRKSGDDVAHVDENRRIACDAIGADLEMLALNYQVHSNRVLRAAPGIRSEHADGHLDGDQHGQAVGG